MIENEKLTSDKETIFGSRWREEKPRRSVGLPKTKTGRGGFSQSKQKRRKSNDLCPSSQTAKLRITPVCYEDIPTQSMEAGKPKNVQKQVIEHDDKAPGLPNVKHLPRKHRRMTWRLIILWLMVKLPYLYQRHIKWTTQNPRESRTQRKKGSLRMDPSLTDWKEKRD